MTHFATPLIDAKHDKYSSIVRDTALHHMILTCLSRYNLPPPASRPPFLVLPRFQLTNKYQHSAFPRDVLTRMAADAGRRENAALEASLEEAGFF